MKAPSAIDIHVGSRIRLRRTMLGMSQEKLGDSLGITFQQVQKYEKGTNRVGASRLQNIAAALAVPIPFFFDGSPGVFVTETDQATKILTTAMSSSETAALVTAFSAIENKRIRQSVLSLVRSLSSKQLASDELKDIPVSHAPD